MKKNWFAKAAASVTCLAMLVGCGGGNAQTHANEVTVNLGQEPPELNSILTTSTGSMNVLRHCMEGLVMQKENDEIVPGVAETWDVSDDSKTYTFHLRKDAKWSNGDPVTAQDFKFAFDTHFNVNTGATYASTWKSKIKGAEEVYAKTKGLSTEEAQKVIDQYAGWKAVDDYTFVVEFTEPFGYALDLLAFPSFFPVNQKAYEEMGGYDKKYGTTETNLLYNGRFTITKWTHNESLELTKNDNYWDKDSVKLDKITMKMIADANTALNEYKAGNLDMMEVNGEQVQTLEADDQYKDQLANFDDGGAWYFEYNFTSKGFNNKKVRQAITSGIDVQSLVEKIMLSKHSKVSNMFTPPAITNGKFGEYCGDILVRKDFAEAKKLLEEGLAEERLTLETFKPKLLCDETTAAVKQANYIQEQLKTNLGLTVEVDQKTYKARLADMDKKNYDFVLAGWGPDYNDPMTYLDLYLSDSLNNHAGYANPEYDEIVTNAQTIADQDKYFAELKKAEEILADEQPVGFLYNRNKDYILNPSVKGVVRTAFQDINLNYAYIEQ